MKKKYGYLSNFIYILKKQWLFKKGYIIALLTDIPISVSISLLVAFLPKIVLDYIENNASVFNFLLIVTIISLLIVALKIIEKYLYSYEDKCLELSRQELYRKALIEKIIDMDYNHYIYNETRVIKEKANRAIHGRRYGVVPYLSLNKHLFTSAFGFTAFATIIAQCNVWFIPILIISYAISSVGWIILQKYNDSIKEKRAKVFLKLNYVTFRSKDFSNAKDIRIYNMVEYLMKKINRHLKENTEFDIKKNNGHFANVFIEDFLKFAIGIGAYLYLIKLKVETNMTLGDFSLYLGAITGFSSWLSGIVDSISNLIESNYNVNDYRCFLDIEDSINEDKKHALIKCKQYPYSIELKNVSFAYDGTTTPTIDNMSLSIRPGEKIAIVGVNGAGKSTLVKLISGLFLPQSGNIYINGRSSRDYNREEYFSFFSAVFQDTSLLPTSIAKNISLCEDDKINREKLFDCLRQSGLEEKINSLPYKENTLLVCEINEDATAFSGGEIQRLLLARALYKDAPIIILDEPTAALDPIAENNIYLKYNELTKGKTSIYISHRLSSTKFCDRIILLNNATIEEIGTHEELLKRGGQYAKMFESQSKYYREM